MYASTEPPEILFIAGSEGDVGSLPSTLGDGRSLSRLTWSGEAELPGADCLLLSETLDTGEIVAVTRSLEASGQATPVIAFVGPDGDAAERVLDAGVTDVIHSSVAAVSPAVVDRRIEAALALSEQTPTRRPLEDGPTPLLREVTENINDVVWLSRLEDGAEIQYVNSAYEDVWGRSPEHLYEDRMSLLETVHPDDRERVRDALNEQREDPDGYDEIYRIVRPDGEHRWVHSRSVGVREDGELVRIVGIVTDITEQKTHQQQLAAERDLVERILETSTAGIVVIDTDRTIVRVNEQAATILQTSQEALQGSTYSPDGVRIRRLDGDQIPRSAFPFNQIKRTAEPLEDEQLVLEDSDGEETIISVDGVPMFDDGSLERVVLTVEDVTDRVTREQRLEDQRDELADLDHINRIIRGVQEALLSTETRDETLQAVCENLTAADRYRDAVALQSVGDGHVEATAWTDDAGTLVDTLFSKTDAVAPAGPTQRALATGETQICCRCDGELPARWRDAFQTAGVESAAVIPIAYDGTEHGAVVVFSGADAPGCARNLSVFDELGETVGHAVAAVESRQREETLTALYEATRRFLTAETPQEISNVAVNTATDVLDLSGIGIFLFDEETNLLEPVAETERFLEFFGDSPVFGPGQGDSITWHTYVTGEPQCFADVRTSDRLAKPDTSARASLLIPLGEHGVFAAATSESGVFTGQRRKLVGLLATTVETALDRVAGQADIRERDAALEERTQELERADQLLSASRTLMEVIRDTKTREELEAELCERLVEETTASFAWVGHWPADSDALEPRSWAGSKQEYLDAISLSSGAPEPAVRTAQSGEITAVSNVATQMRDQAWAREAIERGFQSALAIPLGYGETDYGVLTVYGPEQTVPDDSVRGLIEEFGSMIAYGINSVETRRGMLADGATELEISLGQTDTFLNAVASLADKPVSYREITPLADQATQVLFSLSDPPIDEILALDRAFVGVESLTHTRREATHLFRATLSGETVGTDILDCGGIPQSVTATPNATRATVRVSAELTVREFLDRLGDHYPDAELLARQPAGDVDDGGDVRRAFDGRLTDRQREVLASAYESGFFKSPRETTGEELAELLDLSQPTVTHHLREGQRRLFASLFDDS